MTLKLKFYDLQGHREVNGLKLSQEQFIDQWMECRKKNLPWKVIDSSKTLLIFPEHILSIEIYEEK